MSEYRDKDYDNNDKRTLSCDSIFNLESDAIL